MMELRKDKGSESPLILALETSGRQGSVAIGRGKELLGEIIFSGPMKHSTELFPAAEKLLAKFDKNPGQIEEVYISAGPGSFTGLRISVTLAKILNLADSNVKIAAVDTLDVIAANGFELIATNSMEVTSTAVILDAKRGQFFTAFYELIGGRWEKTVPDCMMSAREFLDRFSVRPEGVWVLGEGLVYYSDQFAGDGIEFFDEGSWSPRASRVHLLGWEKSQRGEYSDAMSLKPFYLRKPDIGVKKNPERKSLFPLAKRYPV